MARRPKRKPDLSKDLDYLLRDLCTELGFCNRLTADDLLSHGRRLDALDFARAVLEAEGMDPDQQGKWLPVVRDRFIDRFGSSVSADE